jgi:hypothetical protein
MEAFTPWGRVAIPERIATASGVSDGVLLIAELPAQNKKGRLALSEAAFAF